MNRSEEESIDFKPFFDLVLGVLFILLILVAAQIFFAQWAPETAPNQSAAAKAAAQEAERRSMALDRDANLFLDDLAHRLKSRGFTPVIDRLNLALSVPEVELLALPSQIDGPRTNREAAARFAIALQQQIICLNPEIERAADCRPPGIGQLSRVSARLMIAHSGAGATPDPLARIAAIDLASALFSSAPQLLAVRSPAGSLVVGSAIEVGLSGSGAAGGRVELRVGFVDSGAVLRQ